MGRSWDYGCAEHIRLDLNMVSHMSYYTGILFEVYAANVGFVIGSGGRYNNLLGFGSPLPPRVSGSVSTG